VRELRFCFYRPCDIEGHRGKDGKLYVLDTARVFPPRPPSRGFPALLLSPGKKDMQTFNLVVQNSSEEAKAILRSKETIQKDIPVLSGMMVMDKVAQDQKKVLNQYATIILGSPVYGSAVVIPAG
jgi:hypothetical protein